MQIKIGPPRDQILEWTENPITIFFKLLAENRINELEPKATEVFAPFDALKTQELLCSMNAAIDTWENVVETLEGEGLWYEFSSEDESEE
jgi:hypothetical protein